MSRWSTRRGQTEPVAVLAAVFAVGAGIALYAGVVDATLGGGSAPGAEPTLRRVWSAVADTGVVTPGRLSDGLSAAADGYEVRITLAAGDNTWAAGPTPPADAATASRRASVRVGPGHVDSGRLQVEVWS